MRFLLRLAFWLGVVLVLLPSGGSQSAPKVEISAGDAFSAARATMADAQKFCERQPDACVFGSQAAIAIGHRAQAGAKMVYDFLNEQLGPNESRARQHLQHDDPGGGRSAARRATVTAHFDAG